MIHNGYTFLFGNDGIEVMFKHDSEFFVVGFLEHWCTSAWGEVGTLSGNNVKPVVTLIVVVAIIIGGDAPSGVQRLQLGLPLSLSSGGVCPMAHSSAAP